MTPGLRTSEFKVAVLLAIGSISAGAENWVSNHWAFIGSVAGAIGYIVSRGLAKNEPRGTTTTKP